ncbi:hypothetical protein AF335_07710 [Streptomyces eurocidicus]|uniref:Uncharacterized protein n=1 Tax=Streptomyces eurocidicus TaxID=66423 RepID=A0A2N8P0C1_STREU|nr:hypothetical protein [Streptomyces eurocidicus]MBB5121724.1 hypothetical protein [Streptomyces eurocidicus]MBF6052942.1 hypothetical protein [Streptomyces eurocidicus]PNE34463.1 hypothetical protein AF335_07710 [Streptomyces eurocidicus]
MTTPTPIRLLRSTDLLDLTFTFPGLRFADGLGPRRLVRANPQADGLLVVTFGPQHVLERAFDEERPTEPRDLPVESLISGRSVLVFEVGPQDSIDYGEAGLLDAMRRLRLRVVDAAREPDAPAVTSIRFPGPDGGPADGADDTARAFALVRLLRTTAELTARYGLDTTLAAAAAAGAVLTTDGPDTPDTAPAGPQDPLADPAHPRTGIELPYRLFLSPTQKARWNHRGEIPEPAPGERVELWHTRTDGRTARAVWNRDRDPEPGPPPPFPASISPAQRTALVDLTSGEGLRTPEGKPYVPVPVTVDNLMLSAVGGWLDSLGTWPVRPAGTTLSEWRHRASMGRDHYVRLMFSGRLCPFGHRADLVLVTERKFTDPRAAFLLQRLFIVVREPVRTYEPGRPLPADPGDPTSDLTNVLFPFITVRLDTLVTPNLSNRPATPEDCDFVPATATESPFLFKATAVDHARRVVEFRTPLLFLTENRATGDLLHDVVQRYNGLSSLPTAEAGAPADPPAEASAALLGQSVALAPGAGPDDTSLDIAHMVWRVAAPPGLAQQDPARPGDSHFLPQLYWATATVPAVSRLGGGDTTVAVAYAKRYALSGFRKATEAGRPGNAGEVFLGLLPRNPLKMDFQGHSDRSGGLVAPSFDVAGLSRTTGPVSGAGADALEKIANGDFHPDDFFRALDANLLGIVPLAQLIKTARLDEALKVPRFFTETVSAVTGFLSDLRRVRDQIQREADRYPAVARRVADTAQALVKTVVDFFAQRLAGHTEPLTMRDVDAAFDAFSAALTELFGALPPDADPGVRALLVRVREQVATWTTGAGQVLSLRRAVEKAADGVKLPETVNARLEWNPGIQPWGPGTAPVFVPDPVKGRFSLVVDLRGSLRPDLAAGADITCTLEEFKLALVPGFEAMELEFTRIRFTARAGKKPDIEVVFRGVRFTGPLTFVETLRKLIPVDGFSDPPGIQVTPGGIVASYGLPLPNLAIGVFSLENLRLDASLDLPFVGRALEVRFSFCTRQAPFRLTVSMLGGGGFFGITVTPKRVAVLEAALEFGAALSMNFGVASGSLSVMAGIYFRLEIDTGESRLTGYFRARGEVDVLGIVSASIELYLELTWDFGTHTVFGRARITISIHIGFWSQSVTIECEKRFVGSGATTTALGGPAEDAVRPPTFAEMMAPYTDPATGARRDPVDEYCTAFAEVS